MHKSKKFIVKYKCKKNLALNGLKWEPASLHLFPSWPLVWIWNPWDPRLRPLMKPLTSTGPLRVACSMISSPNIRRCQLEIAKFTAMSILRIRSVKCNTLMQFYDSHFPVLWSKWPLASSLLQAIKTCRQACPPSYLMHFS